MNRTRTRMKMTRARARARARNKIDTESMSPKFVPKWIRDAHLILVRI